MRYKDVPHTSRCFYELVSMSRTIIFSSSYLIAEILSSNKTKITVKNSGTRLGSFAINSQKYPHLFPAQVVKMFENAEILKIPQKYKESIKPWINDGFAFLNFTIRNVQEEIYLRRSETVIYCFKSNI